MLYIQGAGEVHTGFWWGDYMKDLGVDGKIILKWDGRYRLDCCGLGTGGGACGCGNEPSDSIKCREFLD
jgi:hypothetical protein